MNPKEFQLAACTAISRYFNDNADVTGVYLSPDDIYTVWSCKTLQNNKGLFTTPIKDGLYYEATYNGDKQEQNADNQMLSNFSPCHCNQDNAHQREQDAYNVDRIDLFPEE